MLHLTERHLLTTQPLVNIFKVGVYDFANWWLDTLRAYPLHATPEQRQGFWQSLSTELPPNTLSLQDAEVEQLREAAPFTGVFMNTLLGLVALRFNVCSLPTNL